VAVEGALLAAAGAIVVTPVIRLPAIVAIAVLGAVAGVELGRSSIAEIDPIYFSTPESTRFFADLVPGGYRPTTIATADHQQYWAAERDVVGRSACVLCRHDPFAPKPPAYADARPTPDSTFRSAPSEPPPSPPAIDLDRYMSFPVTEQEANRQRRGSADRLAAAESAGHWEASKGSDAEPIGM
jgi:hypothetical protein